MRIVHFLIFYTQNKSMFSSYHFGCTGDYKEVHNLKLSSGKTILTITYSPDKQYRESDAYLGYSHIATFTDGTIEPFRNIHEFIKNHKGFEKT